MSRPAQVFFEGGGYVGDREPRKVIVVPGRIVTIVV
jgi:hypothetical protein